MEAWGVGIGRNNHLGKCKNLKKLENIVCLLSCIKNTPRVHGQEFKVRLESIVAGYALTPVLDSSDSTVPNIKARDLT